MTCTRGTCRARALPYQPFAGCEKVPVTTLGPSLDPSITSPSYSPPPRRSYHDPQGLYTHRAADRHRHHRHSRGDRDPEVREHEVEGVRDGDEVGPSQPG